MLKHVNQQENLIQRSRHIYIHME